ncbi:MAG: hypothetical protein B7Z71_03865 [Acidocella sp. 21-58-7]|nr:MAG: hypothetical protein B7Z71_03865 [Acidocella sp. 21-58-7]HQT65341.1 lytic transglycosylase domain-containing protein [Acidocella sp.]
MAEVPYGAGIPEIAPDTRTAGDYQQVDDKVGEALGQVGQGLSKTAQFFGQVQVDDTVNQQLDKAHSILNNYLSLNGADALAAQASTSQQLQDVFDQGRQALHSPEQIAQYDQTVRTYQERYFAGQVASHAQQAGHVYASGVNQTSFEQAINMAGANPDDQSVFDNSIGDATAAAVKQTQLEGNENNHDILMQNVAKARQAVWEARIQAIGAKDPARAAAMADQNQALLGDKYAPLANSLRDRADSQIGTSFVDGLLNGAPLPSASNGVPANAGGTSAGTNGTSSPTAPISLPTLTSAFLGQESGNSNAAPTSVTGAVGPAQIEPATFQQFAKPGENIQNPSDNRAVQQRILASYAQQYNNDPSRIAVAYFSGPGNVAPAGSPTPWLQDKADPTGKTVSSYVADIDQKLGIASPAGATDLAGQKSQIYAQIEASNLTDRQKQIAIEHAGQVLTAQTIAQQSTAAERSAASEKAANTYMTQLLQGEMSGGVVPDTLLKSIVNDPNLEASAKKALFDIGLSASGQNKTIGYGAGYSTAYNMILAPDGTPGKITDPVQILQMAAPGGSLTPTGAQALLQTFHEAHGSVDQQGIAQAKMAVIDYAKQKLSFENDTGPIKINDPEGQAIFNSKFVPQFEAAYNNWVKQGKDPMQFLQDTSQIDSMITKLRPPAQMAAARIAAENSAGLNPEPAASVQAPAPPPATTIKAPDQYKNLLTVPPQTAVGPYTQAQWGGILNWLMQDPKNNIPLFDKKFGVAGYDGAEIVQRLSNPPPTDTGNNLGQTLLETF